MAKTSTKKTAPAKKKSNNQETAKQNASSIKTAQAAVMDAEKIQEEESRHITKPVLSKPSDNDEVLLSVQHLCQYFRVGIGKEFKAVHNVSFDIKKGEVFGLVGESGCGKTTTGRSIVKLYDITSGSIYFKGQRIGAGTRYYTRHIEIAKKEYKDKVKALKTDSEAFRDHTAENDAAIMDLKTDLNHTVSVLEKEIERAKYDKKHVDEIFSKGLQEEVHKKFAPLLAAETDEVKLKELKKKYHNELRVAKRSRLVTQIQMIYQDPIGSLNPRMTVGDIIAEGLIIKGIKDKEYIQEKVYKTLELVGLVKEHATRYPHEFSGGQRQRIGIARSLIMEPEMIIADEPVSALDVSIQAQVINLMNKLKKELGLTILFIAHDLSVVKYFSDRIGVMYYGNLVELASSDELFAHPLHPYTKSLLSAVPIPDPKFEKKRVRITYNPIAEHDYSKQKPTLREIAPKHFVFCNDKEEEKYKAEYYSKAKTSKK